MFPHDYFAAGAFAPAYFPPVEDVTPPVVTGARHAVRILRPVTDPDILHENDVLLLLL